MTTDGFQGMDVEYAQQAAHSMDGGISGIRSMTGMVGALLDDTFFQGPCADRFREDWHGTFVAQLNGVHQALQAHSDYLKRKTQQQIDTSGSAS